MSPFRCGDKCTTTSRDRYSHTWCRRFAYLPTLTLDQGWKWLGPYFELTVRFHADNSKLRFRYAERQCE